MDDDPYYFEGRYSDVQAIADGGRKTRVNV